MLVIFDCDGVLVDSEVIACRVHADVLTGLGYPIDADGVRRRFVGRSLADAAREIEGELGRPLPADFEAALKAATFEAFATSLTAMPHIHAALDAIRGPVCVASSGTPEKIAHSLKLAGLQDRFASTIFSASQVARGKPFPDLFRFAAAAMGEEPSHCAVIEDSVAGVTGAVRAGMTVFGFTGGSHCGPGDDKRLKAAGAALVFDDMRQLPAILSGLSASGAALAP
jgi:HAD superfamily hydrolase (TIGR01509 family)